MKLQKYNHFYCIRNCTGETVLTTEGGKNPTNTAHQKKSEIPFDAARAGLKVTSHLIGCDASSLLHVVPSLLV